MPQINIMGVCVARDHIVPVTLSNERKRKVSDRGQFDGLSVDLEFFGLVNDVALRKFHILLVLDGRETTK
jgi:hypothetical protein